MDLTRTIYVTQPDLPPLAELLPRLEEIWATRTVTNGGPLHTELEAALSEYLGVPYLSLFANGTLALAAMVRDAALSGEVITTPFTFVATAHVLVQCGITPIFVDVDPETGNMDPAKIEAAITPRTTGIMPVHVYGTPCNHGAISEIASRHGLRVLYDAAHAFGVKVNGRSVLADGDYAALSFHATKVFNTFEGGAVVCRTAEAKARIDLSKNFGFVDEVTVTHVGENGKMNEFQSALGLVQLKYIDQHIAARQAIALRYRQGLGEVSGLRMPLVSEGVASNYSYFPIFIEQTMRLSRDQLYERLRALGIFARRYFYPLVCDLDAYRAQHLGRCMALDTARTLSQQVLCLPIYPSLSAQDQDRVVSAIVDASREA
jgi:dTDP-4-amino-4,6-dideoxygalactose transaminase